MCYALLVSGKPLICASLQTWFSGNHKYAKFQAILHFRNPSIENSPGSDEQYLAEA